MEIKITKRDGNWSIGTVGGFSFQIKHWPEGSEFGINEGRISKLWIGIKGKTVAAYDRGWDRLPVTDNAIKATGAIIDRFN